MTLAIRTATRIQDQDDAPVLGAGQDGYVLTWDNATGAFVAEAMSAGVTDHGALTGLSDDDHTQYGLLAGRAGGQTLYGGNAANDDIIIHGTSNATRTTSYVILQPSEGNVGIGTSTPGYILHIYPSWGNNLLTMSRASSTLHALQQFDTADAPSGSDPRYLFGLFNNQKYFSIGRWNGGALNTDLVILTTGLVGIGTTAPSTQLHTLLTSVTTDTVENVVTISHDTGNTAAAGFGAGVAFQLESSTTAAQSAAAIKALWNEATHATRKADLVLTAFDTEEREGLRIRGAGSAPAIGFLGATPAARMAHVADASTTHAITDPGDSPADADALRDDLVTNVIPTIETALNNLGTKINSLFTMAETFGFHATS